MLGDDGLLLLLKLAQCHRRETQLTANDDVENVGDSQYAQSRWQAEPLGFIKTPEPLTRLMWEHPVHLLGLARDAAIFVLTGLEQLSTLPRRIGTNDTANMGLVDGAKALGAEQKVPTGDVAADEPGSEDMSSDYTGDDGSQEEECDPADRDAGSGSPLHQSESALSAAEDPLDLTQVLFFRQG